MRNLKKTLTQRSLALGKPAGSGVTYQLHRTTLNAHALREAGDALWQKIRPLNPSYLIAPGLGAAPLAAAIGQAALRDNVVLETLAVRDPAKSRKGERLVEGFPPTTNQIAPRAVFVDDTITNGNTYRQTLTTVSQSGIALSVVGCAVLIDAWHPHGSRQISAAGVPVFSALRRHDVGLTRDVCGVEAPFDSPVNAPFNLSKPAWVQHGLVTKPEFTRKAIPVIYNGSVIVALDDCSVRSFNLTTGDEQWVFQSPRPRSKGCGNDLIVQSDGFMVVSFYDGTVTKINANTGEVAWSRLIAMAIHSAPTVDAHSVYVSTEDRDEKGKAFGRVVCLDYELGTMEWQAPFGDLAPTQTACDLGDVAVASNDGVATLIDAWNGGSIKWQTPLPALARGRPVFEGGKVIFVCENGEVLALQVTDGKVLWRTRPSTGFDHAAPLLIDRRLVLVDNTMHLLALCVKDGSLKWVHRLRGKCSWRPSIFLHGLLLTWTHDGHVALHCPDRDVKFWETKAKGSRIFAGNTPAAVGCGHVVKLCSDGRLAVFKINREYL